MKKFNHEKIDSYKKTIMDNISDFVYRRKRYGIQYSFAVGFCDDKIDLKDFVFQKRQTDVVIILEKNLYCVLFDSTPIKYAIHAISNLKVGFKKNHPNDNVYISALNSEDFFNENEMLNSLFELLEYSIDNEMEGLVTDIHEMGHSSTLNKSRLLL